MIELFDRPLYNPAQIFARYRPSLVKIVVVNEGDDIDIGTGFHIGDGYIATARHVVVGHKKVEVLTEQFATNCSPAEAIKLREAGALEADPDALARLTIEKTVAHVDADVAVLKTNFNLEFYMTSFLHTIVNPVDGTVCERTDNLEIAQVTDELLTNAHSVLCPVVLMGYPRVPRANGAFLLGMNADINAVVPRYDAKNLHFILSSTARGGFSGGPVIDYYGRVIGITTESLVRDNLPKENGFAAAVSAEPLLDLLFDNAIYPGSTGNWMNKIRPKS